jgi:nucleotide-binding universal stress UspA family protein
MNYASQQDIDMVVLGIRGHTLWEKLLVGSTTDRLVRHTTIPVLAVRQL